jgi:hypothetical protein
MADTRYGRLFRETEPGRYVHHFTDGLNRIEPGDDTDLAAARDGVISIVAIRGIQSVEFPLSLASLAEVDPGHIG